MKMFDTYVQKLKYKVPAGVAATMNVNKHLTSCLLKWMDLVLMTVS